MVERIKHFWKDESGATAIEYGLIGGGISIVILTAVLSLGQDLLGYFQTIEAGL